MDYNKLFKSIIDNKYLVNSYIFYGDNKKAIDQAKIFSELINNGNKNIYLIDKKKLFIDDIKDIVYSSQSAPVNNYKIFIINNFNNVHDNVDDILLKTLEDSPPRIIFILVVKNISTLKETIKSRCQKFYFKGNNSDFSDYLLSYFSQDFFKGFHGVPNLIKEKDIILLLEDFVSYLYLDKFDDYRMYNLIKQAIIDIKFGLEKQLVIDNLMINLKLIN